MSTISEFYAHKHAKGNKVFPEELKPYLLVVKEKEIKNQHNFSNKHSNWKRVHSGVKRNWLIEKKFKQTATERLCSQYRSILNKINKNNFSQLIDELLKLDITNKSQLSNLTDEIFKKSFQEPSFCGIYAIMCTKLMSYYVIDDGKKILFREILMNKLQNKFEQCTQFKDEEELKNGEFMSTKFVDGFITFLGELYNRNVITKGIISGCLDLLWIRIQNYHVLECMCKLLEVVLNKLRHDHPKKCSDIFNKLESIKSKVTLQQKFAIMDLTDKLA